MKSQKGIVSSVSNTKVCKKCGVEKALKSFGDEPRVKDGKQARCRNCVTISAHALYIKNRQLIIDRSKKWAERNPEKYAEYQRKSSAAYRLKYPEKAKAHDAVNNAVRDGRLKKQPCYCGETIVEAHHEDYSKPLDVEWLCNWHHKQKFGE